MPPFKRRKRRLRPNRDLTCYRARQLILQLRKLPISVDNQDFKHEKKLLSDCLQYSACVSEYYSRSDTASMIIADVARACSVRVRHSERSKEDPRPSYTSFVEYIDRNTEFLPGRGYKRYYMSATHPILWVSVMIAYLLICKEHNGPVY